MRLAKLRRGGGHEAGYSLVEMLVVLTILGVVLGGLTSLFIQGSNAELDLNKRFEAQLTARVALDKIRREVHCATVITPTGASTTITLTLPSGCPTGSGSVSWCARAGSGHYALYRKVGTTCNSTGTKYADYLTTGNVFIYTPQSGSTLAKLSVDFPVNVNPSKSVESYELKDDIVLRNSVRL